MSEPSAQQAIASAVRLHSAGRAREAEQICRDVLASNPRDFEALQLMGVLAGTTGRTHEAIDYLRRAVELRPDSPQLHYNLGKAYRDAKELAQAAESFKRALDFRPDIGPAWNNLGNTYKDMGRLEEAIDAYQHSLRVRPSHPQTLHNLGLAYRGLMRLDDAMRCFDTALTFDPSHVECQVSRAMVLLARGEFDRGWNEYEARIDIARAGAKREYPRPIWDGLDPQGRTILLHAEQGFGDTIQFARYAPLLAARGATVIVECQPELKQLLKTLEGVEQVVSAGDELPDFDYHRSILSMPMLFRTTLQTIPADVPYLRADRNRILLWNQRIGSAARRIGIVWAGAAGYMNDRNRSLTLDRLAPLARAASVTFVSLQKGPAAEQAKSPPEGMNLIELGPQFQDFADTAATIENLDLVICVDTAVAHLAGAMAAPVWVILPFSADWRWMLDRDDSPWYPTMRLFRQTAPGDWDSVIERMVAELESLLL